jgi:hypothetical protein
VSLTDLQGHDQQYSYSAARGLGTGGC